jgi:hypothetical protein
MSILNTKQLNSPLNITGSLFGSASYATTASFALNAGGAGFPFTGNAVITGSLLVSGSSSGFSGITGSLQGTASWANNARTASFLPVGTYNITASWANKATEANIAITALNGGVRSIINGDGIDISPAEGIGSVTIQNNAPRIGPTYNQLLLKFSQSGTDDPTFIELVNTTGRTVSFIWKSEGYYMLSLDGTTLATPSSSIILSAGYPDSSNKSTQYVTWYEVSGSDSKEVNIFSAEVGIGLIDDVFQNATVDIRRYDS